MSLTILISELGKSSCLRQVHHRSEPITMNSDLAMGVGELSTSRKPVVEHHKVAWYYQGLQLGNVEHSCIKWIDCVVPPA